MIPSHAITRVRELTDFPALVASYTPLRKSGAQWLVLCPFHRDKRPSCRIYPAGPTPAHYHCYACGASGSPITWVMKLEGLPFIPAVRYLAERVGLSLEDRPISRVAMNYAREEALICDWWWRRRRVAILALTAQEEDWELCEALGRLLTMPVAQRFTVYRALVTQEERAEYREERSYENQWLTTWLSLARASKA